MIYVTPTLSPKDDRALEAINELREGLRFYVATPRRWHGTLRRATTARVVQGSNTIEGYHASVEEVAAVMANENPRTLDDETRMAISGYRDAMTYVIQQAREAPVIDASMLRALHFMITRHDLSSNPGLWRPGPVWVNDPDGRAVYEAPERSLVEPLVAELLHQIAGGGDHVIVVAAMAHLNLVLVHPFSDGNGRVARCLQSLVLGCEGLLSPEFLSIEEYLGRNTSAYYAALREVSRGRWSPGRSARPLDRVLYHRPLPPGHDPPSSNPRVGGLVGPLRTTRHPPSPSRPDSGRPGRRRAGMAAPTVALLDHH